MRPKAKIIAIAEANGFRGVREHNLEPHHLVGMHGPMRAFMPVPDYLGDRDAMHDAMSTLTPEQLGNMSLTLTSITRAWSGHDVGSPDLDLTKVMCATAEQLADAFLITIGKMEDES